MSACFSSSKDLLQLISLAEQDAWLSLGLMFHLSVLPLTRQLTNLSGFQWAKVLRGGRAQRIEYLLLHEFHGRKFIVPDKKQYQSGKGAPFSPVQSARKFSAHLGVTSAKSSNSMRPAGAPPISMSKNTTGLGIAPAP